MAVAALVRLDVLKWQPCIITDVHGVFNASKVTEVTNRDPSPVTDGMYKYTIFSFTELSALARMWWRCELDASSSVDAGM